MAAERAKAGDAVRAGPLRQLLVLAFLGGLVGLGVRSLVLHDARFGWGMFTHHVEYRLEYAWILEDGEREPYDARRPYSRTLKLAGRARYLSAARRRSTRQGIGALRSWIAAYLEDAYASRPPRARALEARLEYSINRGDEASEVLVFPAREEARRG